MKRRLSSSLVLGLGLALAGSCGPQVDLSEALAVTDVLTGYYDNGPKDGGSHLVPSINFRLRNDSEAPLAGVQLTVQFWRDGDDGEWDSALVTGIDENALAPGASTEPILVRLHVGYTQQGLLVDLFDHLDFRDTSARVFARRGGRIILIGEFPLEHRLIPRFSDPGVQ